jgi:hypothetical protein
MVPDCELTEMATADAFYLKQIAFTFIVPGIVLACLLGWAIIWVSSPCVKVIKRRNVQNYTVLSIVLMLFLCFPMLARLTFSTLRCIKIGHRRFLMAE